MRVLVIGSEGFIGQALVRRILAGAPVAGAPATQLTRLDLEVPAAPAAAAASATASATATATAAGKWAPTSVPIGQQLVAGDLADAAVMRRALEGGVDVVFHLASVPGGAAEQDFELGLRVNLLATQTLLEALRSTGSRPRLVYASSIAVYGVPLPSLIDEQTLPAPTLSYGMHKYMGELLLSDYSRRGYLEGCALRIPGIVARPGAQGLLSLFLSDLIRELSAGRRVVCPVAPDAPTWWMSRPRMVDNLLHAAALPAATLEARRSYLMPVLHATPAQMVGALATLHGAAVRERIRYEPNEPLQRQFASYPPMRCPAALAAGFRSDADLEELAVRALLPD